MEWMCEQTKHKQRTQVGDGYIMDHPDEMDGMGWMNGGGVRCDVEREVGIRLGRVRGHEERAGGAETENKHASEPSSEQPTAVSAGC